MRIRSHVQEDLPAIVTLQESNLWRADTPEGMPYVSMKYTPKMLQVMVAGGTHIILEDHEGLCGYILSMSSSFELYYPPLAPMFDRVKALGLDNYLFVGQVCIAQRHRGKGVLSLMYRAFLSSICDEYEFLITEVALDNPISIRAHRSMGFREVKQYEGERGKAWSIILLGLK